MATLDVVKSPRSSTRGSRGAVRRVVRYAWALPATLVGLLVASAACVRGRIRIVRGVVEAHGPVLDWCLSRFIPIEGGAAAITFGHVVVGRNATALEVTRAHERVHVAQYERWGLFFLPAYCVASLWAAARGGHYYYDNWFERAASTVLTQECAADRRRSSRSASGH
jgi:hypothetical protein